MQKAGPPPVGGGGETCRGCFCEERGYKDCRVSERKKKKRVFSVCLEEKQQSSLLSRERENCGATIFSQAEQLSGYAREDTEGYRS